MAWDDPSANLVPDGPAFAADAAKIQANITAAMHAESGAPKLYIEVSGANAIQTDETDTAKSLAPDGSGSVEWTLAGEVQRGTASGVGGGTNTVTASFSANLSTADGTRYQIHFASIDSTGAANEFGAALLEITRYDDDSGVGQWYTDVRWCIDQSGAAMTMSSTTINAASIVVNPTNVAGGGSFQWVLRKLG